MKSPFPTRTPRLLLLTIGSAIAAVVLFSLFLSREYANEAMNDVSSIAKSKMTHIAENAQTTLDHLRTFSLSMSQDATVNAWMVSDRGDPISDFLAISAIRRYKLLQPFITDVYLVNARTQRVINANNGSSSFADFEDLAMVDIAIRHAGNYPYYGSHKRGDQSYVSFVFPEATSKNGFLIVLFDKSKLEQFVFRADNAQGFSIQVANAGREPIMGTTVGFEKLDAVRTWSRDGDFLRGSIQAGGRTKDIFSIRLAPYDWTLNFALDESEMTKNIDAFKKKITIACFVLLAILLALIVWGTTSTLRPFRRIAKEFQGRLGPGTAGAGASGEAEIIRKGFQFLLDSVQRMDTSLRNYKDIAKEEYLRQWILQGTEANIRAPLSEMTLLPSKPAIRMAIIRIESYKRFSDQYNYQSRKLLKYAMGNVAWEVAEKRGFVSESVDMDGDHLVLLFAGDDAAPEAPFAAEEMLAAVRVQISEWIKVKTALAVSPPLETSANLRKAYDDTYELSMLQFLTGEPKIFSESDLEISLRNAKSLPDDGLLSELVKAVKQADRDRVRSLLAQLMADLKGLPFEDLQFQLRMIVYTVFKSFSKVIHLQEASGTAELIKHYSSLQEAFEWLEEKLLSVMNDQKEKPVNSRKDEIAVEIVDYIQNHLQDPLLSLDSIGDHLGLSNSYIRHVFKEVYDVTLADYILNERISKVKMLLASTDRTIAEIAEMAGFQTKSHFYNSFKKSEGVTPVQYRNSEKSAR